MVECLLALEGSARIPLGTQTPVQDLIHATVAFKADKVALSFSSVAHQNNTISGLKALRAGLSDSTEIWAGGRSAAIKKVKNNGVLVVQDLQQIKSEIERWRKSRDSA